MSKPIQLVPGALYRAGQKVNPSSDERARRAARDLAATGSLDAERAYLASLRRSGSAGGLIGSIEEARGLRQELGRQLYLAKQVGISVWDASPTLVTDAGVAHGQATWWTDPRIAHQIANASIPQLLQYLREVGISGELGPRPNPALLAVVGNPPTATVSCDPCRHGAHDACNSPAPGGLCGCWCNRGTARYEGTVPAVARVPRVFLQGRRNPTGPYDVVFNFSGSLQHAVRVLGRYQTRKAAGVALKSAAARTPTATFWIMDVDNLDYELIHKPRRNPQLLAVVGNEPLPCPQCGGEGVPLGQLGSRLYRRCRACGWDFADVPAPPIAPLAPAQQRARGKKKPRSKQQKKANPLLAVVGNPAAPALYEKGQAGFKQFHGKRSGRFLVFNKKTKKWREISQEEAERWRGPVAIGLGAVPETHYMVPEEWKSSKGPHYYVHEHPEGKEPLEVKDVESGLTMKLPTSPNATRITDWWRD